MPAAPGGGLQPGLLGKLMAAVRPEFRHDMLVFAPDDPVFGGELCQVPQCGRTVQSRGMCQGHHQRWIHAGRPDLGEFAASSGPAWAGHAPLAACRVAGCGFGIRRQRLCERHVYYWLRAGQPAGDEWLASMLPVTPGPGQACCLISCCDLWAHPRSALCHAHRRRWRNRGCPDLAGFTSDCEQPAGDGHASADLTALSRQLRLEVQYALQCRRDDNMIKTRPTTVRAMITWLAGSGAGSLLDHDERGWRDSCPPQSARSRHAVTLLVHAHRKVTTLAEGEGWDNEYPRDTWMLRRLGIDSERGTLQFAGISQPWLKDLAKRWTRWRLSTELSAVTCYSGIQAITGLSATLAAAGITGPGQLDRDVIERHLAELARTVPGKQKHSHHVSHLGVFLNDVRRHRWDTTLSASAAIFPEDYPRRGEQLPRALAGNIMAQVEDPASLSRWDNPAYQLITLILIRCGLRINDAAKIPSGCVVRDSDGAPYLRYWNRKMKREALVPIDEELEELIGEQLQRNRGRWPGGTPVLFPRPKADIDGTRPIDGNTYRGALYRWLDTCEVRDEYGQPVRLTPHQWRHTLGTTLINRDVPQHVVQEILDHDSPRMTAHYARLSDKTVRAHWEKARKVSAAGQPVQLNPDGPLGDAAWIKHGLSRATQALPNGYCQLPVVKTCPHANACLTCPMFVTTPEFLPQHLAQQRTTLQLITAADAAGHIRLAEMNTQVAANLDKIITALQASDGDDQQAAADAS
jgi:integrase